MRFRGNVVPTLQNLSASGGSEREKCACNESNAAHRGDLHAGGQGQEQAEKQAHARCSKVKNQAYFTITLTTGHVKCKKLANISVDRQTGMSHQKQTQTPCLNAGFEHNFVSRAKRCRIGRRNSPGSTCKLLTKLDRAKIRRGSDISCEIRNFACCRCLFICWF